MAALYYQDGITYRYYTGFLTESEVRVCSDSITIANILSTFTVNGNTYNVTSIKDMVFMNKSNLTDVIIPNSITYIGYLAFQSCSSLTSIIIPDSVLEIGFQAFDGCTSLTSLSYTNSSTNIYVDETAFDNTSLTSVHYYKSGPNLANSLKNYYYSGNPTIYYEYNYIIYKKIGTSTLSVFSYVNSPESEIYFATNPLQILGTLQEGS